MDGKSIVESILDNTELIEEDSEPDELEHHGVKGMKWGIRKKRGGSSGKSAPKSREENLRPKTEQTKRKNMTNAELQAKLNRIKMERELDQLLNPQKKSVGKQIVTQILTNAATQVGTQILSNSVQLGTKAVLTKAFSEDLATAIVGGGKKKK